MTSALKKRIKDLYQLGNVRDELQTIGINKALADQAFNERVEKLFKPLTKKLDEQKAMKKKKEVPNLISFNQAPNIIDQTIPNLIDEPIPKKVEPHENQVEDYPNFDQYTPLRKEIKSICKTTAIDQNGFEYYSCVNSKPNTIRKKGDICQFYDNEDNKWTNIKLTPGLNELFLMKVKILMMFQEMTQQIG